MDASDAGVVVVDEDAAVADEGRFDEGVATEVMVTTWVIALSEELIEVVKTEVEGAMLDGGGVDEVDTRVEEDEESLETIEDIDVGDNVEGLSEEPELTEELVNWMASDNGGCKLDSLVALEDADMVDEMVLGYSWKRLESCRARRNIAKDW